MIYIGSDHGGYLLKRKILKFFKENSYDFLDCGNKVYDKNDDYPDYAFAVAEKVAETFAPEKLWRNQSKGILICKSAAGVVIAANKVNKIRAVAVFDMKSAIHSRLHNDSNIIALSGSRIKPEHALKIISVWLRTEFTKETRHIRRLNKITEYEQQNILRK